MSLNDDSVVQRRAAILRQSREAAAYSPYGDAGGGAARAPAPASLPSLNLGGFGSGGSMDGVGGASSLGNMGTGGDSAGGAGGGGSNTNYLAANAGAGFRARSTGWGSGGGDASIRMPGGGGKHKSGSSEKKSSWITWVVLAVVAGFIVYLVSDMGFTGGGDATDRAADALAAAASVGAVCKLNSVDNT
jgi:hypothetical protein